MANKVQHCIVCDNGFEQNAVSSSSIIRYTTVLCLRVLLYFYVCNALYCTLVRGGSWRGGAVCLLASATPLEVR